MLNFNTKEKMLLQDEKKDEELCVKKYQDYSNKACDPNLKNLFSQLAQKEQEHLNSINQMLSGTLPNMSQGQQGQQSKNNQSMSSNVKSNVSSSEKEHDKMLCQDSLATEKYVSAAYNTGIFEFTDSNVRQVLNHIQKEEQEHGKHIYDYMSQNNMYN